MKRICFIVMLLFLSLIASDVCFAETSCIFYKDKNFKGEELVKDGEVKQPVIESGWSDKVSSVKVSLCYKLWLYRDDDFGDDALPLYSGEYDDLDAHEWNFDDSAGSYKIEKFMNMTGFSPKEALPGEKFVISGEGFEQIDTTLSVTIGETSVSMTVMSDTQIEVTVPANAEDLTGPVKIHAEGKDNLAPFCDLTGTTFKLSAPEAGFIYYDVDDEVCEEDLAVKRKNNVTGDVDYLLEINQDFSESSVSEGYFENIGNPEPEKGRHWYPDGEEVIISINGIVYNPTRDTRHVIETYTERFVEGTQWVAQETDFESDFESDEEKVWTKTVTMSKPRDFRFHRKTEYALQIMTMPDAMSDESLGLLDPPAIKHWYKHGAQADCSAKDGCLQLEGYRDSIKYLAETAPIDEDASEMQKTYIMEQPVQLIWQYEAHRYDLEVTIGEPVSLSDTAIPADVLAWVDTEAEPVRPASTDHSLADQSGEEVYFWSKPDLKLFPLIGDRTFQVEWQSKEGGACSTQKLITTITTYWPSPAHYEHVAKTPPVQLDPRGDDAFAFDSLKYKENENITVSENFEFTASEEGRSTLLFTDAIGKARVRAVRTRNWNNNTNNPESITPPKFTETVDIGKEITPPDYHDAEHNGYVFWEKARYNVNVYDRETLQGQIFPVNSVHSGSQVLAVIWYDERDNILWPCISVKYDPQKPSGNKRIVIASQEGSECKDSGGAYQKWPDLNGEMQEYMDPARYKDLMIYQQPDPELPGYNPNEEHALIATSFRHGDKQPPAVFALRDDLNITTEDENFTSENYALAQYYDVKESGYGMEVFDIERDDPPNGYKFEYPMKAGDPVMPPYPLDIVIGAAPPTETCGRNGDPNRNCYWEDHKGQAWAVSGNAWLFAHFWYSLYPSFWYNKDEDFDGIAEGPGEPIPWLPSGKVDAADEFPVEMFDKSKAIAVKYTTVWPDETPVLKAGETLTFQGGEYRADHPETREGLPMVLGWAAGQVVFDDANPRMMGTRVHDYYQVRLAQALEERKVDLSVDKMPETFQPAAGKVKVVGGRWYFRQLHSGLKTRVFYDPLTGELGIRGFVNGKTLGDDGLTASPPSVYVLQPNILTKEEKDTLRSLEGANTDFKDAVDALYTASRSPGGVEGDYTVGLADANATLQGFQQTLFQEQFDAICGSLHSLCPSFGFDDICEDLRENYVISETDASDTNGTSEPVVPVEVHPFPEMVLGPGLALITNPTLLDPTSPISVGLPEGYVTLAENNHPALGSLPVALHIMKVSRDKYRGAIKTIESDNVFDEKITLRHTADFGANPENVDFEWYYREEDGTEQPPPDTAPGGTWKSFPGTDPEIAMTGIGASMLTDNLFFCRYKHENGDWSNWAGAANSRPPKPGEDPSETYQAQLAVGWVKRVINGLNPFEARINDFYSNESPATYTSMITQAGQRFEGAVAFNPAKDVIENVGLIELYQTVLNRAQDLTVNLGTDTDGRNKIASSGITSAMLLAASRIAGFYTLLGNEAYTDALDPTIGFGTDSVEYGSLAPAIFTFMNQVPTLIDEELGLLRGKDEEGARPAYNRLLWNFTKAEGEAAYALSYNIQDVDKNGFIDEADGRATYPQGHGDAWGHYLSALKGYYDLLNHPNIKWEPRSEKFQIEGVVMDVDYLDERKFAETAGAKAKAGREIVNLTYRSEYVEDPEGQWQGYRDTDQDRAWGLEGSARRAASGAFFDWAVANAILPSSVAFKLTAEDMDRLERENVPLNVRTTLYAIQDKAYRTESEFMAAVREKMGEANADEYGDLVLEIADNNGLKRIDRTTVPELLEIASQARQIQQEYDQANSGLNPLGLANGAVPFDIDPSRMVPGAYNAATQFEQAYERATGAMDNVQAIFNIANDLKYRIRQVANDTQAFSEEVDDQDRDYRNRLIEIFGTPYEGTIGSGKAFPAGYKGPDYFLYMYVDVNEVSDETVPEPSSDFTAFFTPMNKSFLESGGEEFGDLRGAFSHFFDTDMEDVSGVSDYTGTDFNELGIQFPMSAGQYSFQAPSDWGIRKSPGEIHQVLIELIKAETDLQLSLNDYNNAVGDIQTAVDLLEARSDLNADQVMIQNVALASTTAVNTLILEARGFSGIMGAAAEGVEDIGDSISEGLPKVLGLSSDATAPARGTIKMTAAMKKAELLLAGSLAETGAQALEYGKDVIAAIAESEIVAAEYKYDVQQQLKEIDNLLGSEAPMRMAIFKAREHMRQVSEKYRAVLAKGLRLLEERKAFNQKVAAKTQGKRYMDMSFRLSMNKALSKYRSMFDIAARYAYMAGKAYDYETNLDGDDAASAKPLLTDMVKERTLGQFQDGQYVVGQGGLGDILTRMKANFDALKGQMGFNNPQSETGRFSLRREMFRVKEGTEGVTSLDEENMTPEQIEEHFKRVENDEEWRKILETCKKENLWDVPEFRKFCRPFAPEDSGEQPGFVIPFQSNIIFGKNFFGWPLSGGDHAYDPTNFATKVRSVGIWFEGYDNSLLSETPRVYLIPAGMDIMLVPNSSDMATRQWTVVEQKLPIPMPAGKSDMEDPDWFPALDSLNGTTQIRRYSSCRAYHDSGYFDDSQMSYDSRLIGRSVWNTQWMIIIPGGTFHYNSDYGVETFINTVTDIKLFFQTYAISGG